MPKVPGFGLQCQLDRRGLAARVVEQGVHGRFQCRHRQVALAGFHRCGVDAGGVQRRCGGDAVRLRQPQDLAQDEHGGVAGRRWRWNLQHGQLLSCSRAR